MKKLKNKYVITEYQGRILTALIQNQKAVQLSLEDQERSLLGRIYIGKVKNIVANIAAAFIEIENGIICYYSMADNKHPIITGPAGKHGDKLKEGDELLVQVEKEGVKTKAPVVTSHLNFAGKYSILTYGKPILGISNKITDKKWKTRVKEVLEPMLDGKCGYIVRTNAKTAALEELINECKVLKEKCDTVIQDAGYRMCFSCVWKPVPSYVASIRDIVTQDLAAVITDLPEVHQQINDYMMAAEPKLLEKLCLYDDPLISLTSLYSLRTELERALNERVWLPSGGYLIIQPTEALVVVDVNTGKYLGKKTPRETVMKINMEAAYEIARQLRVRNLSGIVIVDFIDLNQQEDKDALMDAFGRFLKEDPVKVTLVGMTGLNLVELTRKKIKKPLYEQMNSCADC